jgi:hypothetical protein
VAPVLLLSNLRWLFTPGNGERTDVSAAAARGSVAVAVAAVAGSLTNGDGSNVADDLGFNPEPEPKLDSPLRRAMNVAEEAGADCVRENVRSLSAIKRRPGVSNTCFVGEGENLSASRDTGDAVGDRACGSVTRCWRSAILVDRRSRP